MKKKIIDTQWSYILKLNNPLFINIKFTLFLKSFNGAPLFTLEELKLWEECFNQIDIVKIGKYPSKKSLISEK